MIGKRKVKKADKNNKKRNLIIIFILLVVIGSVIAGIKVHEYNEVQEAIRIEEERVRLEEEAEQARLAAIVAAEEAAIAAEKAAEEAILAAKQKVIDDAAMRIKASDDLQSAWEELWLSETAVSTGDSSDFATITSCEISELEKSKIAISGTLDGIPESDDNKIYLFSLATYESTISDGAEPIISTDIQWDHTFRFRVNLNYNQSNSRLYDKFVVAVLQNGTYTIISAPRYVTNPEAIAAYTYSYPEAASIKGLLVNPFMLETSELEDLGVKQAVYNIPIGNILGQTTNAIYPTVYYTYNGQTYAFNGQVVAEYDYIFSSLTSKGIIISAVLLNNWNSSYLDAIHPNARTVVSTPYYMYNGNTEAGVELLAAVGSFLASRYSGTQYGQVVNWIIGNEIDARIEWNYYPTTDVTTYTTEYAEAFRVFYNAIKSINSCARVYMPITSTWNRNLGDSVGYDGRDILDAFNEVMSAGGNIDWGLSHHPYPVPLTNAAFWDMPTAYKNMNLIQHNVDTPMINMGNLEVLTDYLCQEEFLTDDGEVRSIVLGELGFTVLSGGEGVQAAAFAYAYYVAEANQHIDAMLLSGETDIAEEVAQGLAVGLSDANGNHRQIYNVYKQIDTANSASATEFAKSIIGISSWSDVIIQR